MQLFDGLLEAVGVTSRRKVVFQDCATPWIFISDDSNGLTHKRGKVGQLLCEQETSEICYRKSAIILLLNQGVFA